MKRAYKITFSIIKTADIWVLADSEESAKDMIKRDPRRIKYYHYCSEVEEPECYEECSIFEVPDVDPLYDENLKELTHAEYERLRREAIEEESLRIEAIEEVIEERMGE